MSERIWLWAARTLWLDNYSTSSFGRIFVLAKLLLYYYNRLRKSCTNSDWLKTAHNLSIRGVAASFKFSSTPPLQLVYHPASGEFIHAATCHSNRTSWSFTTCIRAQLPTFLLWYALRTVSQGVLGCLQNDQAARIVRGHNEGSTIVVEGLVLRIGAKFGTVSYLVKEGLLWRLHQLLLFCFRGRVWVVFMGFEA